MFGNEVLEWVCWPLRQLSHRQTSLVFKTSAHGPVRTSTRLSDLWYNQDFENSYFSQIIESLRCISSINICVILCTLWVPLNTWRQQKCLLWQFYWRFLITESPEMLMNSPFPNGACLIFNVVFTTKVSYIRFICFKASTFHI